MSFHLLLSALQSIYGTTFRLVAFVERDIDRAWRNSISALTEPRSV